MVLFLQSALGFRGTQNALYDESYRGACHVTAAEKDLGTKSKTWISNEHSLCLKPQEVQIHVRTEVDPLPL